MIGTAAALAVAYLAAGTFLAVLVTRGNSDDFGRRIKSSWPTELGVGLAVAVLWPLLLWLVWESNRSARRGR